MDAASLLASFVRADGVAFSLILCVYACLAAVPFLTLVQYLSLRRRGLENEAGLLRSPLPRGDSLPRVLIQLPTFDEGVLIKRVCAAVAAMDWPKDRLKVQILDDGLSADRASEQAADGLRGAGVEAVVLRRTERRGYKAGAMADGLAVTQEPFVAIFDADYVPPADFIANCMRALLADDRLAFAQGRCDYLNGEENGLTRVQQLLLDAHFAIEQPARCWSGQILPFNGTCGVWRRSAIDDAGGWRHDTLAEDMDLSVRAQLRGWRALFLTTVTAPGELPSTFATWRRQQFRWTKGSAEVARKLMLPVWRSALPLGQKLSCTLNLSGGLFGLLLTLALVTGAVDVLARRGLSTFAAVMLLVLVVEGIAAPVLLQLAGQKFARGKAVIAELPHLPKVAALQVGVTLANLRAGFEALVGKKTTFERTAKRGGA